MNDDLAASLQKFGMSQADIEAQQEKEKAEARAVTHDFEVYADCWDSVRFFLRVQTQWLFAAGGLGAMRMGLDNTAIEATMRMLGVKRKDQIALLDDVQLMEMAVLDVDAERVAVDRDK